jgi:hypothetical protein
MRDGRIVDSVPGVGRGETVRILGMGTGRRVMVKVSEVLCEMGEG